MNPPEDDAPEQVADPESDVGAAIDSAEVSAAIDGADRNDEVVAVIDLVPAIEAILFVVEAPVSLESLAAAVQQPVEVVREAIEELRTGYDERQAGIELREVAGGVRFYTRLTYAPQVEAFLQDGQRSRLTQAALETLAVIAYRQPVTRSRVSAIRGVNVDGVVRTLTTRGLVIEVGADPETGGALCRTTELFLEKMGLRSLNDLPSLAPLLPDLDLMESDEV